MSSSMTYRKSFVALAVAAAFGLGAIAADRHGAATAANAAANPAPVAAITTPTLALPDFADLVARHGPAVVEVSTAKSGGKRAARRGMPDQDQLPPWFRGMPHGDGQEDGPSRGVGSGFVVDSNGIILTNAHVVADADEVIVKFQDNREFTAKVLGSDRATDVAVLKIDAKNLPTVATGDPAKTRVGEWVVAIGAPFGLENTVTSGIVSAKSRSLPGDSIVPFIQTDAAVNPGNSGGPLFNLRGEVIGINSQIFSRSGGNQGLAFAIPIDVAMNVKDQIVTSGKASHGKLGVTVQEVNQSLAENFGLKQPGGALVGSVQKDGPGAVAGLEPGDVIVRFDGKQIVKSSDLPPMVAAVKPGSTVKVEVWRDGKAKELTAKIGEREDLKVASTDRVELAKGKLGVAVRPLTPEERKEAKLEGGVVGEEVAGAAAKAGVQQGDVIVAINRTPVTTPAQLKELVGKSGKTAALLVQREDARIFIPVTLG
jgi:serine protease Do